MIGLPEKFLGAGDHVGQVGFAGLLKRLACEPARPAQDAQSLRENGRDNLADRRLISLSQRKLQKDK